MCWRCRSSDDLYIKKIDEEDYVVFNASSGQTHLLNELAVMIIELIQEKSLDILELTARIEQVYEGLPPTAELQIYIKSIVTNLDNIGLIEPDIS